MLNFVEDKLVDWEAVKGMLEASAAAGQWTNFGPVSRLLEQHIAGVSGGDRAVIATSSGTAALYALVQMHNFYRDRPLKWVVSAYTFACQRMGPLADTQVVDCDESGMLELDALSGLEYDGVIVTNIFGTAPDLGRYARFCQENGKVLVTDAAMAYDTARLTVTDEIVSFHHTKPWGVGEGGCVVVGREHEHLIRSIINFGSCYGLDAARYAGNGKMSDPSAAFILARLRRMDGITAEHRRQYRRVSRLAAEAGLPTAFGEPTGTPPFVPLMCHRPTTDLTNEFASFHKYYKPLADLPRAKWLYDHIMCVPCHPGVGNVSDEAITAALRHVSRY